ncbi:Cytochrome P450, E-class, group IV [Parasponia andersonii]|uniref:Cytochrome P450, E-class, group IV n=1 Tax=Parasponia andersonii TaxID=3476 RepID=A0A2P5E2J3_PARAD|nr:Cytochrome P450, E-class, group IV [Parasponia andersonii]
MDCLAFSITYRLASETRKKVLNLFSHKNPNPDGISKLKIISLVINESLRLYPLMIGIIRKVDKEVGLGHLILLPNLHFYISNLALHHDPQIWGEVVHKFKSDRFSQGIAKTANDYNGASFFPFGIGPQTCVGMNLALTQVKIALSMILQRDGSSLPSTSSPPF